MTVTLASYLTSQTAHSRRDVFALLKAGDITVNGEIATAINMPIKPFKDKLRIKGQLVKGSVSYVYYKMNKPKGVICTMEDPEGRAMLKPLLKDVPDTVFPIGRLDRHTKGLLLFTNHGEFSNRVSHPSYSVTKTYRVSLDKPITKYHLKRLTAGIMLEDGPVLFKSALLHEPSELEVILTEGRNRIIRRVFTFLGYEVIRLKRLSVGPVQLSKLKEGHVEKMTLTEIRDLKKMLRL
jgi:23S rRNA pseudouridine2605 synthase